MSVAIGGSVEQQIRFATASDGVSIAYATVGSGPPLVKAPNYMSHLEYEWHSPIWRHWWEELAKNHLLVRFDQRGEGFPIGRWKTCPWRPASVT